MKWIMIVQFLNTGPFLLMINSDMRDSAFPILGSFIKNGKHSDFTKTWYNDIGQIIIISMIYNVFWPALEFGLWYFIRFVYRFLDNPLYYLLCCIKKYKYHTKKESIPAYLDIYCGPQYLIHYKYSSIINIVFITFMFGAGIPILYPIAFLSLITFYVIERLLVAYSYREPPLFDQSLNREAIKMLMLAPILYLSVGFWMYSNKQIFSTEVYF